jgi:hypothetical protein
MLKRARVWIGAVLVVGITIATVSWTRAVTVRLTDERGAPASDAYVRYHYEGYLINPVHPVTYVARGSVIIRADSDGRFTIPARIHVRRPLPLSTPPRVFIDHVVVPRLHNAFGPLADGTMSHPGVFTVDERREHVTVLDVSQDPERWQMSLGYLFDCIRGTLARNGSMTPTARGDTRTGAHARELVDHLRREYAAFLAMYGRTARQRPAVPQGGSERDRQQWEEQIDAQLAREPVWGPFMERMWRFNMKELDGLEASLK